MWEFKGNLPLYFQEKKSKITILKHNTLPLRKGEFKKDCEKHINVRNEFHFYFKYIILKIQYVYKYDPHGVENLN